MKNLGFIGAQNFSEAHFSRVFRNFQEIKRQMKFRGFEKNEWRLHLWRHSTSPPCRNLVDGLPHDCHTKTIAKRARVGPRTQVHMPIKMLFQRRISSSSVLGSPIIVLDNVLKIWIELIIQRNDNAREKFYRFNAFEKLTFLVEISKISKFFEKITNPSKQALLLYELSEREPG